MTTIIGFKCLDCRTQVGQLNTLSPGKVDLDEEVKCPHCGSKNVEYKMKV